MNGLALSSLVGSIASSPGGIVVALLVAGTTLSGEIVWPEEPSSTTALFKAAISGFATVMAGALAGLGLFGLWRLSLVFDEDGRFRGVEGKR